MSEIDGYYDLNNCKDILESSIAQSIGVYGVSPSVGRIYSVLYYSQKPMTFSEIQAHVAMSKASVSNGLRELTDKEMVLKIWKKGKKHDHYIVEKDCYKTFLKHVIKMISLESHIMKNAIEQTEPYLRELVNNETGESKDETEKVLKLIENDKQYLEWTSSISNAMESGEFYNFFPKSKE